MQEKKALSSRGRGRLSAFLELRRPWDFLPRHDEDLTLSAIMSSTTKGQWAPMGLGLE